METRRTWLTLFTEAVETETRKRDGLALQKMPPLHMFRMLLDEATALDEAVLKVDGQGDVLGNECLGHCGV